MNLDIESNGRCRGTKFSRVPKNPPTKKHELEIRYPNKRNDILLNYELTRNAHQLNQADLLSYMTKLSHTHNIDNNILNTINTAEES